MDASSNNIPIEYKMRVTETFTETFTDTFTETLHKLRRIWQALFFVTVQDLVPGTLQLLKISELHESILHQCQSSAIQLVEVQKNEEQKTENHTLQPHFATTLCRLSVALAGASIDCRKMQSFAAPLHILELQDGGHGGSDRNSPFAQSSTTSKDK